MVLENIPSTYKSYCKAIGHINSSWKHIAIQYDIWFSVAAAYT